MDARVLLITGSRVLAGTISARAATRSRVAWAIANYAPDLLVHGAAVGADELAEAEAHALGLATLAFPAEAGRPLPTGEIASDVLSDASQDREWTYPARKPLARNAAMVDFCVHLRDVLHAKVAVLALHAPWSGTGGTQHTVELAKAARLRVQSWTCPAAFAPTATATTRAK